MRVIRVKRQRRVYTPCFRTSSQRLAHALKDVSFKDPQFVIEAIPTDSVSKRKCGRFAATSHVANTFCCLRGFEKIIQRL